MTPSRKIHLVLLAALAPVAILADPVDWTQYARSFEITFPGYTGTTTLTDFPVLVRLSKTRNDFRYNRCTVANGGDLRFSDANGNLLASEVDTWDENGESLVWVKVPTFTKDTVITAHYGCATPVAVNPKDVWSNGFVGVWHLNESARPLSDSTANGFDFTASSTVSGKDSGYYDNRIGYAASGLVGKSVSFDNGDAEDHRGGLVAYDKELVRLDGYRDMTFELWTCVDAVKLASSQNRYLLTKWKSNSSLNWAYQMYDSNTDHRLCTQVCNNSGGGVSVNPYPGYVQTPGQWTYSVYVFDAGNGKGFVYFNGSDHSNITGTPSGNVCEVDVPLCLGNRSAGGDVYAYPGSVDELRISSVPRSADWVKATYDTIRNDDFNLYMKQNDWTQYTHSFTVAFTNAPATPLTDFPVLVKLAEGSPEGFSYADMLKPDGGDLRFSDAEDNLLDSEVDIWDPDGVSTVWVKIPSLTNSTKITAYYGWVFAPADNPKAVWSNGYVGVWHLGESARPLKNSTATEGVDFTRSNNNLSSPGYYDDCMAFAESGAAGKSVRFSAYTGDDEAKQKRGGLIAYDPQNKLCGFDAISLEIWAKVDAFDTAQRYLLCRRVTISNGAKLRPYDITYAQSSGLKKACATIGLDNGLDDAKSSVSHSSGAMGASLAGSWNYHCFQYDKTMTSHTNYLNGVFSSAKDNTTEYSVLAPPAESFLCLGNDYQPNSYYGTTPQVFNGSLDELRISNVARSDAWVKATYDTIKNNATFTSYGEVKENANKGTILFFR